MVCKNSWEQGSSGWSIVVNYGTPLLFTVITSFWGDGQFETAGPTFIKIIYIGIKTIAVCAYYVIGNI